MGTQWARQEAKKNELAVWVDKATLWVKFHPQPALWGGVGLVLAVLLCVGFANRHANQKEDAWSKLAMIQSYAYSGHAEEALGQVTELEKEHPKSAASEFAFLLSGDVLFEQGKYKEAADSYQKALAQTTSKTVAPLALANLGLSQEASGECKAATETDQKFLDSYADHFMAPPVQASLARCLASMGEKDKAKAAFDRIVVLYPQTYWSDWAKARVNKG